MDVKTKVAGLLAALVAVPAIINSVNDAIVAFNDLPIGDKAVVNSIMFRKYFKESPIMTKQLLVKGPNGKKHLIIDVWEYGDILVDYGDTLQWLPYKGNESPLTSFSNFLLPNASVADEGSKDALVEVIEGDDESLSVEVDLRETTEGFIQIRTFANGSKLIKVFDKSNFKLIRTECIPSEDHYDDVPDVEDDHPKTEDSKIVNPGCKD